MKTGCSIQLLLLSAASGLAKARLARRAMALTQYTPDIKDWSTLNDKPIASNPDHNLDSVHWIDESDWLPWNGTPYNASQYSRGDLADLICPGNTILGLREVFNQANPFSDPVNPTKAEVDNWHTIAINHVRALVGYTEEEYQIEPDQCLHVRALWSEERAVTDIWDVRYPDDTCVGSTKPHCGASFIPAQVDQAPYLPDGIESCGARGGGSEGIFSAAKSNIPWSIRFVRPLCSTLGSEGFWGGHTGPWFHRKEFGFSWYDSDPDDSNSNTRLLAKWAGDKAPNKYVNPRITNGDFLLQVEGEDPNPRFDSFQCTQAIWFSGGSPNATDCYNRVMADEDLNKRFFTWKADGGCAGYPAAMETCEVFQSATRLTWDLSPRSFSFDGVTFDPDDLLWNNRECKNIKWKPDAKAGDASQCLENLMALQYEDCGRNFMTWNSANGGCACYAPEQPCDSRADTVRAFGRKTYRLVADPAFEPPSPTTQEPTSTAVPTHVPTTAKPTTGSPTDNPTAKPTTASPTNNPTAKPVTDSPTTAKPTTGSPTDNPTAKPTTASPTNNPTAKPVTDSPTTGSPTNILTTTASPTNNPTMKPATDSPTTAKPTTGSPTNIPTAKPTTASPTNNPTAKPTTASPTNNPTAKPITDSPTTAKPTTGSPTGSPTDNPTAKPTHVPTPEPTSEPTTTAACSDVPGFRWRGKKNKDCGWAGMKPDKRCKKRQRIFRVWDFCRATCCDAGFCEGCPLFA